MPKRPFKRVQKKKRHGATFWDHEYANPSNLKLSSDHSADLEKFVRFMERETGHTHLNQLARVVDVGCGNGRNLIYLAREYGIIGTGYDASAAAVSQAKAASAGLDISYSVRDIALPLELENNSQNLVLDMMASHFLEKNGRERLREEIFRVLKPGGFLFMKTFLRDEDKHTERLLKEAPGSEEGSYIHPVIGVAEYVYPESELLDFLNVRFQVLKTYRSHKHISKGKARKRRTISVYARKPLF